MGRGDRKSKKGKILKGSYGVVRTRKKAGKTITPVKKKEVVKKEVEKKTASIKKKAPAKKKTTAKK